MLNFPNNLTGYSPREEEVKGIISAVVEAGIIIVLILDDAYFGLFYEDSVQESLFGKFAGGDK